jgi:hypothetical protein
MKRLVTRRRNFMSILTVLIMIGSWFAASNHCALGAGNRGTVSQTVSDHGRDADADSCPFHSRPATPAKQKQSGDVSCCKILRALAPTVAKSLAAKIFFVGRIDFVLPPLISPPKIGISFGRMDTGPPGALSFAESVLHRSIRAHAPPSFA